MSELLTYILQMFAYTYKTDVNSNFFQKSHIVRKKMGDVGSVNSQQEPVESIILIYSNMSIDFFYWRFEVDSLNIKVHCLLTASSRLSYFKKWRR